ncbi:MAG: MATE family efflux transporter [Pseudomonadota bacterium]
MTDNVFPRGPGAASPGDGDLEQATTARLGAVASSPRTAKFVDGSLLRHILVMTASSTAGLMALFLVDLADMYFLSLLGEVEVAAAVGYAGSILFVTVSVGIGLAIATTALVSRATGANDLDRARALATHCLLFALIISSALLIGVLALKDLLLVALGAEGRSFELARSYLAIVIPSMPLIALAICGMGILRAVGDARRSMYVTLAGALVNGILDPLLIFTAGMGMDGAAWATFAARLTMAGVALYGVIVVHKVVCRTTLTALVKDVPAFSTLAGFAILTNVATPVGNAFVTAAMAPFGVAAVAGWAVISRIIPVFFAAMFALSGAVGPIIGQNLGAERHDRVEATVVKSLYVVLAYTAAVWALIALLAPVIVDGFNMEGAAADLMRLFCYALAPLFGFTSLLFVANAVFNNIGRPHYSAMFNWGRATLGTVPLLMVGGWLGGAQGALTGAFSANIIFGAASLWVAYRAVRTVPSDA